MANLLGFLKKSYDDANRNVSNFVNSVNKYNPGAIAGKAVAPVIQKQYNQAPPIVKTAVRTLISPATTSLGQEVTRGFARVGDVALRTNPVSLALNSIQKKPQSPFAEKTLYNPVKAPILKPFLSDRPLQSTFGQSSNSSQGEMKDMLTGFGVNQKTAGKIAVPLAMVGLGLDILPGGGGDDIAKAISKSQNIKTITQLANKAGLTDVNTIKKLVKETDFNKVKTLLGKVADNVPVKGGQIDPLIAEARKYKSADEFVKAKTNLYHGTMDKDFKFKDKPTFLAHSQDEANLYAGYSYGQKPEGKVIGFYDKGGKTLDLNNIDNVKKIYQEMNGSPQLKKTFDRIPEIYEYMDDYGDIKRVSPRTSPSGFDQWLLLEHQTNPQIQDGFKVDTGSFRMSKETQGIRQELQDAFETYGYPTRQGVYAKWDKIIEHAKKKGYDFIDHTTESPDASITFPERIAINPKKTLLTKSQLRDIYKRSLYRPSAVKGGVDIGTNPLKGTTKNIGQVPPTVQLPKTAYNASKNVPAIPSFKSIIPDFNPKSYIKEQTTLQKQAAQGNSFLDKVQGIKNDIKTKFVDRFSVIEDTLRKSEKQGKLNILPTKDIRPQFDRVLRADSIASQFAKDHGLASVIQDVPDVKAFDQYLIAKQARDVAANGIETGRNLAKDNALIDSLAPQYEVFAKQANKYNQDVLQELVNSGMISKNLHKELTTKYPNYVPLNRVFSEIEQQSMGMGGKGSSVASVGTQKVIKKLVGSEREIVSPVESMLVKTSEAINQAERNKAAQMLVSYKDLPGNPFGLRPVKEAGGTNTVSVFVDGKKQIFEIDPEFARAAKDMGRQQIGFIGQIFAVPTRLLKMGATGINIPFVASNVVKDQVFSTINSSKALKTSLVNPGNFVKATYSAIKQDKLYADWVRSGAAFTSYDLSRNAAKNTVSMVRGQKNIGTKILYEATHPQDLLRTVENIVGKSEELTRIQQFNGMKQALIKEGRTLKDATILAQQAANRNSANFARGGEWSVPLNVTIPYINAGIQGARSLVGSLKTRPVQTAAKIAALVLTPIAYTTVWNNSSAERKAAYDDIPDYEKENNIIILPPNPVKDENGRWNAIKVPLTPGLSNLGSIVRRQIEGTNNTWETAADAMAALTSIDASDPTKLVSQFTPQAIKPVIENFTNTNLFTQQKIVPEYMKDYPVGMQVKEKTSGTARKIGGLLNASPLKVENTVRTMGGGVGQQLLNASDVALNKLGVIPKEQVGGRGIEEQIANRFTSAAGGQQLSNLFDGKKSSNDGKSGIKDNNGKLWVTVDGKPRSFKTQELANEAIAKNELDSEGVGSKRRLNGKIYTKTEDGIRTTKVESLNKQVSDYKLTHTIESAKKNNDWKTLEKSYISKVKSLEEDIANADPEIDQISILRKQEQIQKMVDEYAKYVERGYITKGTGKKAKKVSLATKSKSGSVSAPATRKITLKSVAPKGGKIASTREAGKGIRTIGNRDLYS